MDRLLTQPDNRGFSSSLRAQALQRHRLRAAQLGFMACRKAQLGSILEVSAQRWSRTRLALGAIVSQRNALPLFEQIAACAERIERCLLAREACPGSGL